MDALEFTKELKRMCHSSNSCAACELHTGSVSDSSCTVENLEKAVPIVEKWLAEHPKVRNIDKFAEDMKKFGVEVNKQYTARQTCPLPIKCYYANNIKPCDRLSHDESECVKCRRWWTEEYEGE